MNKSIVETINYAGLKFEGLMLPNGSYGIAFEQIDKLLNLGLDKNTTRGIKAIYPKGSQEFNKTRTENSTNSIWYLTLSQVNKQK